jgi:hypothetical protein
MVLFDRDIIVKNLIKSGNKEAVMYIESLEQAVERYKKLNESASIKVQEMILLINKGVNNGKDMERF